MQSAQATSSPQSASRTRLPVTRCRVRTLPVLLESMVFPDPVIDIAIEPKTKVDQEKLGQSLAKLG